MTDNENDDKNAPKNNNNEQIKIIIIKACVTVGLVNLIVFPAIDAIFHTKILENELPVLQIILTLMKP